MGAGGEATRSVLVGNWNLIRWSSIRQPSHRVILTSFFLSTTTTTKHAETWILESGQNPNKRRVKRGKSKRSLFAQLQANFFQQQCITTWSLFLICTLNVSRFIVSVVWWLYSKDVTAGWCSAWRQTDRGQVINHAVMFVTPSSNVSGHYVVGKRRPVPVNTYFFPSSPPHLLVHKLTRLRTHFNAWCCLCVNI
jgi:hypothetical protein